MKKVTKKELKKRVPAKKSGKKVVSKKESVAKKKGKSKVERKHKKVLKKMSADVGKGGRAKSVTQAAVEEGYSPSYAKSGRIQKTKSWQALLKEYLPDEMLAEHHQQLLTASKISDYIFPGKMKDEEIHDVVESFGLKVIKIKKNQNWKRAYVPVPDNMAKKFALDMAYKLNKRYEEQVKVVHKYDGLSKKELAEKVARRIG